MFGKTYEKIVAPLRKVEQELETLVSKNAARQAAISDTVVALNAESEELEVETLKARATQEKIRGLIG